MLVAYNPSDSSIVLLTGEGDGFTILPPKMDTPVGEWIRTNASALRYGVIVLSGDEARDRHLRRKAEADWEATRRRPDPTMSPTEIRRIIAEEEELV